MGCLVIIKLFKLNLHKYIYKLTSQYVQYIIMPEVSFLYKTVIPKRVYFKKRKFYTK